jgi:ribosomal protein S18 acetylase RimI-like enzyme
MARIGHSGLPFKPHRRRLIFAHQALRVLAPPKASRHAMNLAFRPALPEDFDYCERLYFAEMERINRELKLDRDVQVASFRRQWDVMQVRIITLNGADIGWLQSTTHEGALFLGQLFVDAPFQRRGIGTAVMHRLIGEATRLHQAMTLGVVKTNPAKRLYERLGFRTIHEDERKFYMRREPATLIRTATREDIPRLFEIRGAVRENRLGDPSRVTVALCEWLIENSAFWLWVEDGRTQGFSAADPRNGSIFGLFVDPAYEGRGIGRRLLPLACDTLRKAGYQSATLITEPATRAEKFYRRDGWIEIGRENDGQIIFRKEI